MTPDSPGRRESKQSIKEGRSVQKAADRFMRDVDDMERRSKKLGEGIEQARQEWERKRGDQSVPGANPPQSEEEPPEEASFPGKAGDEDQQSDSAEGTQASPANP